MPRLTGPSHIDLTVTDVERSAQWWETVMGFTRTNSFKQETFHGCGLWHRSGFTVTVLARAASHNAGSEKTSDPGFEGTFEPVWVHKLLLPTDFAARSWSRFSPASP